MEPKHLLTLASAYAAHIDRSLFTVANHAGVHSRFFTRLADNGECRMSAYPKVLAWFDAHWPADLAWPSDIPRPSKSKKEVA